MPVVYEIIETYWNVNYITIYIDTLTICGNNRNILECKCQRIAPSIVVLSEIIETYWNVNFPKSKELPCFSIEIIETYWNVNDTRGRPAIVAIEK